MSRLRVGLFGFGRTGTLVAREVLADPACELVFVARRTACGLGDWASRRLGFDRDEGRLVGIEATRESGFWEGPNHVDVIIDFSSAGGLATYEAATLTGTRIVSAISRYEEAGHELLRQLASRVAVLHSPNITLGVNFLLVASRVMRGLAPEADVHVVEEHFKEKREVSGTAVRLADAAGADESRIHSIRAGGIVGRHEVIFGLPNQTIRLVHESINRAAFGRGAIYAAKWVRDRTPGLYSMEVAVRDALGEALATIG